MDIMFAGLHSTAENAFDSGVADASCELDSTVVSEVSNRHLDITNELPQPPENGKEETLSHVY